MRWISLASVLSAALVSAINAISGHLCRPVKPTTTAAVKTLSTSTATASATTVETLNTDTVTGSSATIETSVTFTVSGSETTITESAAASSGITTKFTGNMLTYQTVSGLQPGHWYRFEFYTTIFSSPIPQVNTDTYMIRLQYGNSPPEQFPMDAENLDSYQSAWVEFAAPATDVKFTLRIGCVSPFDLAIGIENVYLVEL
ncbi:hypothetical protein F53441_10468 [Fusarium austroafricanum]|uniref:CBM-cenC domain-containing protein n=1 Tax=Fusarium austroafricanum TaxID=2364996 RepID=A0A8H4KAC8_9HYPO|nr:hypothetical protein F53441_10468 [Fusarium austroafricanum]